MMVNLIVTMDPTSSIISSLHARCKHLLILVAIVSRDQQLSPSQQVHVHLFKINESCYLLDIGKKPQSSYPLFNRQRKLAYYSQRPEKMLNLFLIVWIVILLQFGEKLIQGTSLESNVMISWNRFVSLPMEMEYETLRITHLRVYASNVYFFLNDLNTVKSFAFLTI